MKIKFFRWFWKNRLIDWNGNQVTVIKVKGWRTALVDHINGSRETVTFLFKTHPITGYKMNMGTKSVLFGAHQFLIHPWFVAFSWWKLYGFPFDPRLWIAFFIHDLGYWGKPDMDGDEGEKHPEWAAKVMEFFFGKEWGDFCLYHSRFYAKRDSKQYSKLCVADKVAISLEPWWFYLPRVLLTGEIHEYMAKSGEKEGTKYNGEPNDEYTISQLKKGTYKSWFNGMSHYLRQWAEEHKEIKPDTWTPD